MQHVDIRVSGFVVSRAELGEAIQQARSRSFKHDELEAEAGALYDSANELEGKDPALASAIRRQAKDAERRADHYYQRKEGMIYALELLGFADEVPDGI